MGFSVQSRICESALLVQGASMAVFSDFNKSDLNPERVQLHIDMLHYLIEQKGLKITTLSDLVSHLKEDDTTRLLQPELIHAIRLILSATNNMHSRAFVFTTAYTGQLLKLFTINNGPSQA